MAKVIWTPGALDNLHEVSDYIAQDSAAMAAHVVRRILHAVTQIELAPEAGRVVPEFNRPDVRERIVFRYRIVYRLRSDTARILAIWHGARLLHRRDLDLDPEP